MDEFMLKQLIIEAEVLLNQFQQALSVVDIRDPEVFSFITHISEALYRAKNWSSDYDGTKEVLSFFWSIFSGWSSIAGYTEREYIPEMIAKL